MRDFLMFQSSSSSLFLVAFELLKKKKKRCRDLRDERGVETLWVKGK